MVLMKPVLSRMALLGRFIVIDSALQTVLLINPPCQWGVR